MRLVVLASYISFSLSEKNETSMLRFNTQAHENIAVR